MLADRTPGGQGPGLSRRERRRELRGAASSRATASSAARASMTCAPASASPSMAPSMTRWTSCSGRPPSPRSRLMPSGTAPMVPAARLAHRVLGHELCGAGREFDIHGGGQRPAVPHHEKRDRPEPGAGYPFARYWLHNGFSISMARRCPEPGQLLHHPRRAGCSTARRLRFFMLRTHYRRPFKLQRQYLEDARVALTRLYTTLDAVPPAAVQIDWTQVRLPTSRLQWTRTSAPARAWPCSSIWPTRSIRDRSPAGRVAQGAGRGARHPSKATRAPICKAVAVSTRPPGSRSASPPAPPPRPRATLPGPMPSAPN